MKKRTAKTAWKKIMYRHKSRASAATGTTSPWTCSLTTAHAQAIGSPRAGTGMVGVMTRHTKSRLERGSGNLGRPARMSLLRTVEGTRELVGPLLTTFARVASTYDQNNASFRAWRRVKTACNTLCTSGTAMSVSERWLSCKICNYAKVMLYKRYHPNDAIRPARA